ncbi:MAG: Na+/H+ antiporter NhaC [Gammaproteobacteria bacterium]
MVDIPEHIVTHTPDSSDSTPPPQHSAGAPDAVAPDQAPGTPRDASTVDVLLAIGVTVALLALSVLLYGADSSQGANQIALVVGAVIASGIGIRNGHYWRDIEANIVHGIATAMPAILILFAVGSLIGVWMLSGTVPTMIYYGLLILEPAVFYPAACLLCAIVSLAIGSSWTVAGTLGIALMGVAAAMGLAPEITAGAVISGAYFGDKMSPLSDTTNLAPAAAGVDLFTHIEHMLWTTTPSLVLALIAFAVLGLSGTPGADTEALNSVLSRLAASFDLSLLTLLPVLVVIVMAVRKVPALATILTGVLVGAITAVVLQPHVLGALDSDGHTDALGMFQGVWTVLFAGYTADTGDAALDELLSRGGMASMLNTVWLIIAAMSFGSAMEKAGILAALLRAMTRLGHSVGALIASTLGTCIGVNTLAGDQYMAIVIPGRMFRAEYARRGLHPKNLSRALEDAGTLTSPLIPWNTCGAYMAVALGVPTLAYLPYCFLNLINPVISALYGFTGFRIAPAEPETQPTAAEPAKVG